MPWSLPARAHTVLYYGFVSAHHGLRSAVVPCVEEPAPEPKQLALFVPRGHIELPAATTLLDAQLRDAAPSRLSWMTLLARVFRIGRALNLLARDLGIPSPRECTAYPDTPLEALDAVYPAFVKPASGDGSVGINRDALVSDATALAKQLAWFREQLPGRTTVIQEYLPGAEYGLALLGNPGSLEHLPPLRVDFSALPPGLPPILAFESKTGPDTPYEQVRVERADLDEATLAQMVTHARAFSP